jgi:hypothetical protein
MDMAIDIQGRWKIKVLAKNAGWDQRFLITGSNSSDGNYPGIVGTRIESEGANWTIHIQSKDPNDWVDSDMRIGPEIPSGISSIRIIESNDQGGTDVDFDDLVLEIRKKQNPIIQIEQRPYSINIYNSMMNPDGIFIAGSGMQIMAVRVKNAWTQVMASDQVLDISPFGRHQLNASGIQVIDFWTAAEMAAFNQISVGFPPMPLIGPLAIGEEKTVFFKLDCSSARIGTPNIEFICRRPTHVSEPDLDDPARLSGRKIFIAQVGYDSTTKEIIAEVPEGQLRLKVQKLTLDTQNWNSIRDCVKRAINGRKDRKLNSLYIRLKQILKDLERSRCDPQTLQDLITMYCEAAVDPSSRRSEGEPSAGYCPLPWLPIKFSYTVNSPFDGQYGTLPFQDPWWKILALIIAIVLLIAAALVDIFDEAHENPEIVIGNVDIFSTDNVDCALIALNASRSLDLGVLDVQAGEPNNNPRVVVGAVVPTIRTIATPFVGMRVYKSGARTGLTHGIITSINARTDQCRGTWDDSTNTCIPDPNKPNLVMNNQIRILPDPDFPGEPTTDNGDSGSLWLSNELATRDQIVALTHSGADTFSDANPISDVIGRLGIRLTP